MTNEEARELLEYMLKNDLAKNDRLGTVKRRLALITAIKVLDKELQ